MIAYLWNLIVLACLIPAVMLVIYATHHRRSRKRFKQWSEMKLTNPEERT
jgi:hypothetical protein